MSNKQLMFRLITRIFAALILAGVIGTGYAEVSFTPGEAGRFMVNKGQWEDRITHLATGVKGFSFLAC